MASLKSLLETFRELEGSVESRIRQTIHRFPSLHGIPYWLAGLAVGVTACLYSEFFSGFISVAQSYAQSNPILFVCCAPFLFVLSHLMVERFAPSASGTGVSTVHRAIQAEGDASCVRSLIGLRVAGVVVLSSLVAVLGGGGLGREGPMVLIAACVFYAIGETSKRWWPFREHRSWLIAGGAAGIAAAFNTPLAGIVFVLEELAAAQFHQFKTVVISSVIMAGVAAQWLSGRYLYLGFPKITTVPISGLLWVVLVAVIVGTFAGLFLRLVQILDPWAKRARAKQKILVPAFLGLCVALIATYVTPRSVGGGINLIIDILFKGPENANWTVFGARFASTVLTHLSGVSGGFLAPSLSLGATMGSQVATWWSPENHNLLVLTGMAGFLAAVTSSPFTALVIVMEMTDRHSAIFPLMIGASISHGFAWLIRGKIARYV